MFKHILMPTDGSEHSERAIERGIELARLCGSRVTGIHVMQDYRMMIGAEDIAPGELEEGVEARERERAARFLAFVENAAAAAGVTCDSVIVKGHQPYDAIVDAANERGCDLIVMTSRYRKSLASLLLGSEATRVLHRASIPVLTFRGLVSADHPDRRAKP
jgi:nucleotide-binding universal stress UspA family protein